MQLSRNEVSFSTHMPIYLLDPMDLFMEQKLWVDNTFQIAYIDGELERRSGFSEASDFSRILKIGGWKAVDFWLS